MERRKARLIASHTAALVLGGVAVISAAKFKLDEVVVDVFASNPTVSRSDEAFTTAEAVAPKPPLKLPLKEQQIDPEILKNINENLVIVDRGIRSDFEILRFPGGRCSGFIVRSIKNEPFVVTARHCFPESIESGAEKKFYSSQTEESYSIYTVGITDVNKKSYGWGYYRYFTNSNNQEVSDVMLIAIRDPSNVNSLGLPINIAPLSTEETYFRVSLGDQGELKISILYFIEEYANGAVKLIDLGKIPTSCVPGTSGSAILNRHGEVVALETAHDYFKLDYPQVDRFNLDPIHVGRLAVSCFGISSSKILELLK